MSSHRRTVAEILLTLALVLLPQLASAQTNTFPSNGNTGIGTTSPSVPLEVRGAAVTSRVTATGTTGSNGKFQIWSADIANNPFGEMQLYAPTGAGSEYLRFNFGNSSGTLLQDILTINRLGNVGIGTANPLSQLHFSTLLNGGLKTYTASTTDHGLLFSSYMDTNSPYRRYGDIVAISNQDGFSGGSTIRFLTNSNNSFTAQERMRIDYLGNVGIGTLNPGGPLDVRDSSGRQILWNMSSAGHSFLNANGGNAHVAGNLYFNGTNWNRFNTGAGGGMWWAGNDGTLGVLQTPAGANPVSAFNWSFFITTNGNVGIGTNTPVQGKLVISDTAQNASRLTLAGQEFYAPSMSSTDGVAFLLGVNRPGNKQLWIADSSALTQNSTNAAFRTMVINGAVQVDAVGTDGVTSKILNVGNNAGVAMPGNVGIGTSPTGYKLDVNGEINATGIRINGTPISGGGGSSQWGGTSGNPIYYNGGNVGIGTTSPGARLHVSAGDSSVALFGPNPSWNGSLAVGAGADLLVPIANRGQVLVSNGNLHLDAGVGQYVYIGWLNASNTIINGQGGNVGIGNTAPTEKLHVTGNGKFTGNLTVEGTVEGGNIKAKYQDLAEWVPSAEQLSAGTVVVLDSTKPNQVISSTASYDTRVAGVISAQPGITLGESGEGKVLVATTGRVRVKVDASRGAIQIGDLLVTSHVVGAAMKSEAVNLGGVQIHRPGTIIGKALEPMAKGQGEILVLLSLQ